MAYKSYFGGDGDDKSYSFRKRALYGGNGKFPCARAGGGNAASNDNNYQLLRLSDARRLDRRSGLNRSLRMQLGWGYYVGATAIFRNVKF